MQAPGQAKRLAVFGALDHATKRLVVSTSPKKRSAEFIAFLAHLDAV